MEQAALPIALISLVLMFAIGYMVATYVESTSLKKFVLPQFETYASHMANCGLLYPAVFCYAAFGLTKLV